MINTRRIGTGNYRLDVTGLPGFIDPHLTRIGFDNCPDAVSYARHRLLGTKFTVTRISDNTVVHAEDRAAALAAAR